MTIIPFFYLEKIYIKCLKYKIKYKKFDLFVLKNELKSFLYIFIVFVFAFILHNSLNKKTNACYTYANKQILVEYRKTYKSLQKKNINAETKEKYLENTIIRTYNNLNNISDKKELNPTLQMISSAIKETNQQEDKLNLNETDYNKLNNVYVVDGVFHYPMFINGNKNTYSGMNCSTNPTSNGYNNPYGYNNYFYTRLTKFIEEANNNGFKITFSTQGCRTYSTQVNYYNTMVKGRAAYPGHSLHGFGIASDLEFYQENGTICQYGRTSESCPSMGWAHRNANLYGLTFPLLNASYKEDWHIEPINKKTY